jgi:hypothetical protein
VHHNAGKDPFRSGADTACRHTFRPRLARTFAARTAVPVGVGLLVGIAGAFVVNRLLASILVGVSPTDPITLAATCGTLA